MYDLISGDYFSGVDLILSGNVSSGEIITGEIITGVVSTGSNVSNLLGSPMVFRNWLWGIVKSVLLWCLSYWYVPVIIIVVYCLLLWGYNYLWGYLLSKLQKKNDS